MFKMETVQMHNSSISLPIKTEPSVNDDSVVSIQKSEWLTYQDFRSVPYGPPLPLRNSCFGEHQTLPSHLQNAYFRQMPHNRHPRSYRHPFHYSIGQTPLYPPIFHNYTRCPNLPYTPSPLYRMPTLTKVSDFQTLPTRLCRDSNEEKYLVSNSSSMNIKPDIDVDQTPMVATTSDKDKTIEITDTSEQFSACPSVVYLNGDDAKRNNLKPNAQLSSLVRNRQYTFDTLKIGKFRFRTYIKPNKYTKVRFQFSLRLLVYDFVYRYKLLESNEKLPLLVLIVVPLDSIVSVNICDTSVTVYLSEAAKIFTGVDRQNLTDEMKNKFNGAQNTIDITKGQIEMSLEHTFTLLRPFGEMLKKCLTEYNPNFKIRISDEKIVQRVYKLRFIKRTVASNGIKRHPLIENVKVSPVQSNRSCCSAISAITKFDDPAEQQLSLSPTTTTISVVHSVDFLPHDLKIQYPNLVDLSDDEDELVVVDD